jgi:hypothetical protein
MEWWAVMARKPRIELEGGLYHVTARVNDRRTIFNNDTDHHKFFGLLSFKRQECRSSLGMLPDVEPLFTLMRRPLTSKKPNTQMAGWIAELGTGEFSHHFGGNGWNVHDPRAVAGGPHLLLDLDLKDPRLGGLGLGDLERLPVCGYLNADFSSPPPRYRIDAANRRVDLIERSDVCAFVFEGDLQFPNPLPRRSLSLREMTDDESGQDYYKACDEFVGGDSFIRILGDPIWVQREETVNCLCGERSQYLCAIGYENYSRPGGFLDEGPFFYGELALYFFICSKCRVLTVTAQST